MATATWPLDFQQTHRWLEACAAAKSEWAGIPFPVEGNELVVEPHYPFARLFNEHRESKREKGDCEVVNSWYSHRRRSKVYIVRTDEGKLEGLEIPHRQHAGILLHTLGASRAWKVEAEIKAHDKLQSLIPEHAFNYYLLTGMFLETSKRSGVTYLFRKLRPTLALRPCLGKDDMRVLCALCLHPIAYYDGSWAGAMVPTDDVIAHLLLMRGDEPRFWRQANQHQCDVPEAGL